MNDQTPAASPNPLTTDQVRAAFMMSVWGWASLLMKAAFIILAIGLVLITVMANMGGNSDSLKKSVEDLIGQSTGYKAVIEKLHGITFFPRISLGFEGLELSPANTPVSDPVIHVESLKVSSSFWDVLWGTGRIQYIDIRDVSVLPGIALPRAVRVDSLSIVDAGQDQAFLVLEGALGTDSFLARMGMRAEGAGKGRRYAFPDQRPFLVELGSVRISGTLKDSAFGLSVEDFKIEDGQDVLLGRIEVIRGASKGLEITGRLSMAEYATDINLALKANLEDEESFVSGTIKSGDFTLEDFSLSSRYHRMSQKIASIFADPQMAASAKHIAYKDPAIRLFLERVHHAGKIQGRYEGQLPLKGQRLDEQELLKETRKNP